MDYLSGGDLRYHICRYRRFNEETTRKFFFKMAPLSYLSFLLVLTFKFIGFFCACLISGLEYIHAKNIIHRDIKPENLVIEADGKYTSFLRSWEIKASSKLGLPPVINF